MEVSLSPYVGSQDEKKRSSWPRLSCLLPSTIQKGNHGRSTDTFASFWVKKVGFLGLVYHSSCPRTSCCRPSENVVFAEAVVSRKFNFKEWVSVLLPRSGWASCCCSENRQIYPLVDLKAEKVTVNTGAFLLSSLINHSMGFTSPVS